MNYTDKISEFKITNTTFNVWEDVFKNASYITLDTFKTGEIKTKISKVINLKNNNSKEIIDKEIIIPVLCHLIKHEKYGYFLIDTGFDSSFYHEYGGNFKGILKKFYFKNRYLQNENEGIDNILKENNIKVNGVFLTHMHEHSSGLVSLSNNIPVVYGKGEKEVNIFPFIYSKFLLSREQQIIDFDEAIDMPILGKCVDIFEDGSLWAIHTPGHTIGHISYLINCKEHPILITGDACITEEGFKIGTEPGKNSLDLIESRESFLKLKKFKDKYNNVVIIYGHESEVFKINK